MDYKAPILLTYFEPFGGETENAAALAAELLPEVVDGRRIVKLQIPVTFGGAAAAAVGALAWILAHKTKRNNG